MDFGIAVATSTNSWKAVQRAEQLGFSHAWFYDTQLLNPDVFIGMTQAAMATSRIRLGTGVLVPSNRIAPVAANAFATLNRIAPGRIDFGVGTGFTARRTMGLGAITLEAMERYVDQVQRLLHGETIEWRFEGQRRKIAFLNPDFGLINISDPVGLHVSAMGPKARRLTAKMGAGWLNFGADVGRATRELEDMKSAWRDSGNHSRLYATLFSLGCVLKPGERLDSDRAMAQAAPQAAVMFHNLVELASDGPGLAAPMAEALRKYRDVYTGYQPEDARYLQNHRGHLMFLRPEERALLSAEIVAALSFTAGKEELRDRLRALARAGYSQFAIQIVEHHEEALEEWARLFETV